MRIGDGSNESRQFDFNQTQRPPRNLRYINTTKPLLLETRKDRVRMKDRCSNVLLKDKKENIKSIKLQSVAAYCHERSPQIWESASTINAKTIPKRINKNGTVDMKEKSFVSDEIISRISLQTKELSLDYLPYEQPKQEQLMERLQSNTGFQWPRLQTSQFYISPMNGKNPKPETQKREASLQTLVEDELDIAESSKSTKNTKMSQYNDDFEFDKQVTKFTGKRVLNLIPSKTEYHNFSCGNSDITRQNSPERNSWGDKFLNDEEELLEFHTETQSYYLPLVKETKFKNQRD
ncbi:hypothetical protein BC833DRAFT_594456 [Globomyces pollinis-pini]|nr:hypothetical protein BC833DRAFT_594456 [Globomyces pollinis-pini]